VATNEKRAIWPVMLVVLLLALVGASLMVSRWKVPDRPNVLWITMDSLRADHLGCYGYDRAHTSHIDRLAEEGFIFRDCIAQGTFTRISLPSLITGKFPFFTGLRMQGGALDSSQTTLAEVLRQHGYATFALANPVWSPSYGQGFQETSRRDLSTAERTELILQKLDAYRDDRFFLWLYYWDPHAPYIPPLKYLQLYEPEATSVPERLHPPGMSAAEVDSLRHDPDYLRRMIDRYDAEIACVDAGIGRVVAKLKELELYDRTLIVLDADHGESFGEHGQFGHGTTVYDEVLKVPLVIKQPVSRNRGRTIVGQVRNLDIMPTVLQICGLSGPEDCDGRSLVPFLQGKDSPELPSVTETHYRDVHLLAYRHQNEKVIYDLGRDHAWLYDLRQDPGERNDLLPDTVSVEPSPEERDHPGRLREQRLRRDLLALLDLQQMSELYMTDKDIKEIDAETRQRLKALGYVY
jgi:arylsulfatase